MKFYSDMQFLLAMQTEASHLADQQKHTIKTLQSECDSLHDSRNFLQSKLSDSEQRESELESQLSWERLQHENLVARLTRQLEEKDVKLVKLKKELETNVRTERRDLCVISLFFRARLQHSKLT